MLEPLAMLVLDVCAAGEAQEPFCGEAIRGATGNAEPGRIRVLHGDVDPVPVDAGSVRGETMNELHHAAMKARELRTWAERVLKTLGNARPVRRAALSAIAGADGILGVHRDLCDCSEGKSSRAMYGRKVSGE